MEVIARDRSLRILWGDFGAHKMPWEFIGIYVSPKGYRPLGIELELPTEWHEEKTATLRISMLLVSLYLHVPWRKVYPDYHQCSGPLFGFMFSDDVLFLRYGQDTGASNRKRTKIINMPWAWKHERHEVLNVFGEWEPARYPWRGDEPDGRVVSTHPYLYVLKSGEQQLRDAEIFVERRTWTRWWIPFRRVEKSINVEFSDEVGERTGTWKGGTVGCGYEMKAGESAVQCLRRMERERVFS